MRISEQARLSNVRVVTEAPQEGSPVSPKVPQNIAVCFLLALLCAVGVAKVLETLDDRIYDAMMLERMSGRPVLAIVPFIHDDQPQLIHYTGYHSTVLESIRLLRGNLLFANLDNPVHVVGISSAGAGEGKSTTAINLAVAFALDGKRVALVDADLRRPSLHRYFDLPNGKGLTT